MSDILMRIDRLLTTAYLNMNDAQANLRNDGGPRKPTLSQVEEAQVHAAIRRAWEALSEADAMLQGYRKAEGTGGGSPPR